MRRSSISTLALVAAMTAIPALAQQAEAPTNAQQGNVPVEANDAANTATAPQSGDAGSQTDGATVIIVQDGQATPGEVTPDGATSETTGDAPDPLPTGTESDPVNVEAVGVNEVEAQAQDGAAEAEAVEVETEAVEVEVEVVEEGEVAEGTPVEGQIFEQSADTFLASSLLGTNVQSPDGDGIGDVDDMIVTGDGMIEGVVIGVGGFLGIGKKKVAIELGRIDIAQDEFGSLTFVLAATREELEAAPEFRTQDDIQAEIEAEPVNPAAPQGAIVEPPATTQ